MSSLVCNCTCTWAHGVVVSHPLCMRKALGSIPSVSISSRTKFLSCLVRHSCSQTLMQLRLSCFVSRKAEAADLGCSKCQSVLENRGKQTSKQVIQEYSTWRQRQSQMNLPNLQTNYHAANEKVVPKLRPRRETQEKTYSRWDSNPQSPP